MRVLLVDDHADLRALVSRALELDGHVVAACKNAADARRALADAPVEVMVLDIALPDGNGVELCRALRRAGETAPILLLTAQQDVGTRVAGLDAGADDFLGKPFAIAELRARVRALARRGAIPQAMQFEGEGFTLDFGARTARVKSRAVPLTQREWALLELLVARTGRVLKSEILEILWGEESEGANASLEVIVGRVRKKLGEHAIRTIRGEGYAIGR